MAPMTAQVGILGALLGNVDRATRVSIDWVPGT
jgi:hypothetical protein